MPRQALGNLINRADRSRQRFGTAQFGLNVGKLPRLRGKLVFQNRLASIGTLALNNRVDARTHELHAHAHHDIRPLLASARHHRRPRP